MFKILSSTTVRRYLCTVVKPTKSELAELRKRTGFSFVNCKKALERFQSDVNKAEKWLWEQAETEGWTTVGKVKDRTVSQGLIGVLCDGQRATLLEVNCETDFVAHSNSFQQLVSRLVVATHRELTPSSEPVIKLDDVKLSSLPYNDSKLSDLVAKEVGVIGENIIARRAVHKVASNGAALATYSHISGSVPEIDGCKFGKFVSVVEYCMAKSPAIESPLTEILTEDQRPISLAVRNVCLHITAMNPEEIGEPGLSETEETTTSSGDIMPTKPTEEQSDIPPNESEAFAVEDEYVTNEIEAEAETCLLKQKFILDESMTVGRYLVENQLEILDFIRLECGEDLKNA